MYKPRFSMLLLEPGEIYFEDFSCTMYDDVSLKERDAIKGRLKLCSKSLVFEPRHFLGALTKLYYKECENVDIVQLKLHETRNALKIKVKQYCEMLEENILAPYKFLYEEKNLYFIFDFASTEECLNQIQQLIRASTLHAPEHNSMVATILFSRYRRMGFDPVMMEDFTEKIICEYQVEKISPLVRHQGKLALTFTTLYFQPFNNIEGRPILKLKLNNMKRIYKRRFLLRQVGLEIYCSENTSVPHIYLIFQSREDRAVVYKALEDSPDVNLEKVHIEEMTLRWQNGIVSNYDYLIYLNWEKRLKLNLCVIIFLGENIKYWLDGISISWRVHIKTKPESYIHNSLADRSKNDLTQYPVFPWVVADYSSDTLDLNCTDTFRDLSKPMGALNKERLEKLLERYQEMSDPRFLYGSHYSAPGLVLFYIVRKYPQYMLCLQNGRFDHPDRMFNSVAHVYSNCLKNMSDFKELLPEFYDTNEKGDFLLNVHEINFGVRYDGRKVDNVELPPWAATPEEFVGKLREALESDYVSRHLHLWIDLIFGYKQRGEEAVKANNVFHHVCYEGSVDLDLICDMNDRHAYEVQIMEFGQVPKQLFTTPHVRRIQNDPKSLSNPATSRIEYEMEHVDTVKLHKEAVTCALYDSDRVISVGKDGTLKVYDMVQKKQIRSIILSTSPLSSCVMVDKHIVAAGSWSNEIYLYDMEYGRVVDSFRAHDDSVSCLVWLEKDRLLISGGWDAVARVWANLGTTGRALRGLQAEFDHDGKINTLSHRYRGNELEIIAGTVDGDVYVWDYGARSLRHRLRAHENPLSGTRPLPPERLVITDECGHLNVTDLSVSNTVYLKRVSTAITSLCGDGVDVLWLGGAAGVLLQWSMATVSQLTEQVVHEDDIHCIFYDQASKTLLTASKDKSIKIWKISNVL